MTANLREWWRFHLPYFLIFPMLYEDENWCSVDLRCLLPHWAISKLQCFLFFVHGEEPFHSTLRQTIVMMIHQLSKGSGMLMAMWYIHQSFMLSRASEFGVASKTRLPSVQTTARPTFYSLACLCTSIQTAILTDTSFRGPKRPQKAVGRLTDPWCERLGHHNMYFWKLREN